MGFAEPVPFTLTTVVAGGAAAVIRELCGRLLALCRPIAGRKLPDAWSGCHHDLAQQRIALCQSPSKIHGRPHENVERKWRVAGPLDFDRLIDLTAKVRPPSWLRPRHVIAASRSLHRRGVGGAAQGHFHEADK